jgi:hypothetical protein
MLVVSAQYGRQCACHDHSLHPTAAYIILHTIILHIVAESHRTEQENIGGILVED